MGKKKDRPPQVDPTTLHLPCVGADCHAHLDFEHFEDDFSEMLRRASASGLAHIGNVFLGPNGYDGGVKLLTDLPESSPEIFFCMGVHPHDAVNATDETLSAMATRFTADTRLKALGEIGLDFYYDHSPREVQERVFREQLTLARELDLPVVLHSREAEPETLAILDDMGYQDRPLLWHCFGGGPDLASEALARGFMLSIPGTLTFKKSHLMRQAVARLPLDRIMVETDSPYLTPVPYRGKRNEPAYAVFTAAEIARLKETGAENVWAACGENTRRFFGL